MKNLRWFVWLIVFYLFTPVTAPAQFTSVRIQVIDVGQGDAILVRTPNTQWVLIDGGQTRIIADSLPAYFGVNSLSLAIISHRHKDHIGGMDDVIGRIPISRFVGDTRDYASGTDDDRMRDSLSVKQVNVLGAEPDTVEVDGVRFIILPRPPEDANENNNSVMVRLEFGEFSMLFAGDSEDRERNWLVANHADLLDADVLKASHHGSRNGTSDSWRNAITPAHIVISAGVHAGFKHPHPEAVNAYRSVTGGRVFCTNRHGTIRVFGFADGRVRIERQRATEKSCIYDGTWY